MRIVIPGIGIALTMLAIAIACGLIARWNSVYRRLAARYRGHFKSAQLWCKPRLLFNHGMADVLVGSKRSKNLRFWRNRNRMTQVVITPWPSRRTKLEMLAPGQHPRIWGISRHEVVSTGDFELDRDFVARSNEPHDAANLFSAGVISHINQLRALLGPRQLYFGISSGKVTLGFSGFVCREQLLDDFIRICLETYDQAIMTLTKGIDFVAEDEAVIIEDVKCPVCSCDIVNDMVVCIRCKTPHCKDCWKYNGKCATFGCGETRYLSPAAPLHSA